MKYKIYLVFILFPVLAFSQKTTADSAARTVLNELIGSWTLGIDSSSESVDIRVYNTFKNLFDVNATVDDGFDIVYIYDPKKRSGVYQIRPGAKPKTFDVYAHDVALQVRSIAVDSMVVLDANTSDLKNMIFTVKRWVKFQKVRQYVVPGGLADEIAGGRAIEFENKTDSSKMLSFLKERIHQNQAAVYEFTSVHTLRIEMAYRTGSVRLTNIKDVVNEVVCINDADNDAVLNDDDSLMNKPGDFTAAGKPDYDLDGVPDDHDKCRVTYGDARNRGCPPSYFLTKNEFDGYAGWQSNSAKMVLPPLTQWGYRDGAGNSLIDTNPLLSTPGFLHNPGRIMGIHAGLDFVHYFGQKKKRAGISIGFSYSGFTAEYTIGKANPLSYTYKAYDSINFYRRRITVDTLNEEIRYGIFNLPVLFNYRVHLSRNHRAVLKLQAGPSLMIFSNTSNDYATVDFEGLYQTDTSSKIITYLPRFVPSAKSNLLFTIAEISKRGGIGADSVFKLLGPNYDFARGKLYNGKQPARRVAVAANLTLDLQYKVSEGLTIKLGPHFAYAYYLPAKTRYRPVNSTTDPYQSIYKSNAKLSYSAYGANLGFVYDF